MEGGTGGIFAHRKTGEARQNMNKKQSEIKYTIITPFVTPQKKKKECRVGL